MTRRQPEAAIQRTVIDHVRWRHFPGCFWFHVPNGGHRRPVEAAILQSLGASAGVPELIFVHNAQVFALELKARGRQPTPTQLATTTVAVAHGVDEAIAQLEAWGLLRRNRNSTNSPTRRISAGLLPANNLQGN